VILGKILEKKPQSLQCGHFHRVRVVNDWGEHFSEVIEALRLFDEPGFTAILSNGLPRRLLRPREREREREPGQGGDRAAGGTAVQAPSQLPHGCRGGASGGSKTNADEV